MRYRIADLIDFPNREKWRRRLGWSPVTYLRTTVLIVREASAQLIPFRPRYIVGLGREWYFNPPETRIRISRFRSLLAPFGGVRFIVFSRLEPDGSETDLVAITRRNRLDAIRDNLKVAGFEMNDAPSTGA